MFSCPVSIFGLRCRDNVSALNPHPFMKDKFLMNRRRFLYQTGATGAFTAVFATSFKFSRPNNTVVAPAARRDEAGEIC